MKTRFFTNLFFMLAIIASAQQEEFTGIKAGGNYDVVISQSDNCSVKSKSGETISNVKIKNGILHLPDEYKEEKVFVTVKSMESVENSGVGNIKGEGEIVADKIKISGSGAGNTSLKLRAKELFVDLSGVGKVTLSGSADLFDAEVPGAGSVKALDLETQRAHVRVSGVGSVKTNVVQELDAHISGAGNITYKGNPPVRNVDITGVGSVKQSDGEEKEGTVSVDISLDTDKISVEEDTLESENPDTTRIKLDKVQILIIEDEKEKKSGSKNKSGGDEKNKHWAGLYLGVNGYSLPNYSLNLPAKYDFMDLNYAKSIHFAFNFLEQDIKLHKEYAKFVTGLGFDFNTYAFKNNITFQANKDSVWGVTDTINKFTKNKFKTTFVNVPLLFAFNTHKNPDKAFHIATGVILGYDLVAKTKQHFNVAGEEIKSVIKDDYNLNPFRASATLQLGYSDYNLYASYSLTSLFATGKGPELYPFTVGIRILGL